MNKTQKKKIVKETRSTLQLVFGIIYFTAGLATLAGGLVLNQMSKYISEFYGLNSGTVVAFTLLSGLVVAYAGAATMHEATKEKR